MNGWDLFFQVAVTVLATAVCAVALVVLAYYMGRAGGLGFYRSKLEHLRQVLGLVKNLDDKKGR